MATNAPALFLFQRLSVGSNPCSADCADNDVGGEVKSGVVLCVRNVIDITCYALEGQIEMKK